MRSLSVRSAALACALVLIGCDQTAPNAPPAPAAPPAPPATVTAAPVPMPTPPVTGTPSAVPMPSPPGEASPPAVPLPDPKPMSDAKPAAEPKSAATASPAREPAALPASPPVATTPVKAVAAPGATQVVAQADPPAPRRELPVPDLAALPEVRLIGNDAVLVSVLHIDRIRKWPVIDVMRKAGALKEPEREMQQFGLTLDDFVRATVVVDQELVNLIAKQAGLAVRLEEGAAAVQQVGELRNNLKQIGLSFHNYHDVFGKLPRSDGDGEGQKTGLSWRVHILPFLDQAALYNQFHLDEAWDSEHNKALIERMPKVYQSPGVDEPGKTSVHVFTGKGTPFDGDTGKGFRDFTDGLSNTLFAVLAGPDTAEIWTKPGGLPFDSDKAEKNKGALGKLPAGEIQALFADGACRPLPVGIDPQTLTNMIQMNDGNVVDLPEAGMGSLRHEPMPTLVVSFGKNLDRALIAKAAPSQVDVDGETLYVGPGVSVWIADDRTAVAGMQKTVERLIRNRKARPEAPPIAVRLVDLGADASLAVDIRSQSALLEQVAATNPLLGIVTQIESLLLNANVTKPAGETLLELVATTSDDESAKTLSQIVTPALKAAKQQYRQLPIPPQTTPEAQSGKALADKVVSSAAVTQEKTQVALRIPVPEGFETLPDLLKPAVAEAQAAAERSQRRNNIKMLGIAFHSFHEVHNMFPGAGRGAEKGGALSWRVHLLPYIDEAALYNQFHLDEPWDSPHNKTLIEKMPALFQVKGIDKPGMTSLHVFTGKGAPFADDRTPAIRDYTDGTSNTALVVEAAPDTAQIWTKPGGLDFDPKKPLEALGKLPEDFFLMLLTDGSVRTVSRNIDQQTLRRLIEFQDGEPLSDF
ncbi:DUF1559 domain-containing protein [Planctomyces sp. SH-PL14]|uniref:DUF1559 family PulG-like putative transporter n=1 Tax=Planctomyces sp. SH-PL14 TaxID=1632864 RepID=UPI00078B841E|nr:DUF1559 domain-containing protein [Planctomyces sp. SH-PL14]AMV19550.1 hypothetical protein VT03_16770 [Planctomyces sp. SH-PL14]